MDALAHRPHHAPVCVLPHIKKLDDALGDFLVRVTCPCGRPATSSRTHSRGSRGALRHSLLWQRGCDARSAEEGRRAGRGGEAQAARSAEESALGGGCETSAAASS
jgi:hypothetical protein